MAWIKSGEILYEPELDALYLSAAGSGVFFGCAVSPSSGMTLAISSGTARWNGTDLPVSSQNITLPASDPSNPRRDLIVVGTDGIVYSVQGSASVDPSPPALPANRVLLAVVFVTASASVITSSDIYDRRVFLSTAGTPAYLDPIGALM